MSKRDTRHRGDPYEQIPELLDAARDAVGASSVFAFAFSPVSHAVELIAHSGHAEQMAEFLPKLGFSPVCDVCINGETFIVDNTRPTPPGKDRWLRKAVPYSACIGVVVTTVNPSIIPCLFAFWRNSETLSKAIELTIRLAAEKTAHAIDVADSDREIGTLLELAECGKRAASLGHDLMHAIESAEMDCVALRRTLREDEDASVQLDRIARNLDSAISACRAFSLRRAARQDHRETTVDKHASAVPPRCPSPQHHNARHFRRILLLEDSDAYAENLLATLASLGHEVLWAKSIPDAFSRLSDGFRPDLILSDRHLSGMSVDACLHRLRAILPESTIMIYTATKFMTEEEIDRLREYGADGVISKQGCRRLAEVVESLAHDEMTDIEAQT